MKNIKIKKYAFILLVLGLVLITTGTTYAIFRFTQVGTTESSMQVGSITFHYKEINGKGHGINISNAYPISDVDGKAQNDYFDFRITSNSAFAEIPYTISVVPAGDVELANVVKLYLTEVNNNVETQVVLSKYSELTSVTFTGKEEKVLYRTTVPVDGSSYEKNYRLRMWIDSEANFNGTNVTKYYCGDTEVERGTICDNGRAAVSKHSQASAYNNKSLSLTVNVHTNDGQTLTQDNVTTPDDTSIKMLTANNTYLFNNSTDEGVDLEVNVPNEVDSINLNTTLTNMRAVESITPLGQTLSYADSPSIRKISTSNTYNLLTGDNFFKLHVTSADTTRTKDYILKVTREKEHNNNLTYLAVENYAFNEEFDSNRTSYSVSVEEESITITGNKSSQTASISGLGEKTLSWGINNYTITVTAEDGTPKDYNIEVNNVKPTAPTITGGTNGIETSLDQTISILSPGTAVSGVAYYEYYTNTTGTAPTDSTTGTQLANPYTKVISDNGTTYIWYRTVSNKGNKSTWSEVQEVNISKVFSVTMAGSNVAFSSNTVNVNYGRTNTVTVTPASGYYISGYSCTNNYTISGLTTLASATSSQTITINNNNQPENSICTFTTKTLPTNLKDWILADNTIITTPLTSSELQSVDTTNNTGKLYNMSVTNSFGGGSGDTYFFRGNVTNNVVKFAGQTWRIVRINEDGTIRLILDSGINDNQTCKFNDTYNNIKYMYYSESGDYIKKTVNDWYDSNIGNNSTYTSKIAAGNYFCEAAKVKSLSKHTSGSATMSEYGSYTPTLDCTTDGNSKGLVNASVGLITYDEVVLAGGKPWTSNKSYYLYKTASGGSNDFSWLTMSPAGFGDGSTLAWYVYYDGYPRYSYVFNSFQVRPVINLKADVSVTKNAQGHYIVQ